MMFLSHRSCFQLYVQTVISVTLRVVGQIYEFSRFQLPQAMQCVWKVGKIWGKLLQEPNA